MGHRRNTGRCIVFIPSTYWPQVTNAISQIAKHIDAGLCIRPKPNELPLKLCLRKAAEGSHCCTRHKDDCPTK